MRHMLPATEHIPMGFAVTGKGNGPSPEPHDEIVKTGAAGLKLQEVSPYYSEAKPKPSTVARTVPPIPFILKETESIVV